VFIEWSPLLRDQIRKYPFPWTYIHSWLTNLSSASVSGWYVSSLMSFAEELRRQEARQTDRHRQSNHIKKHIFIGPYKYDLLLNGFGFKIYNSCWVNRNSVAMIVTCDRNAIAFYIYYFTSTIQSKLIKNILFVHKSNNNKCCEISV
jgi:hypothetical protein